LQGTLAETDRVLVDVGTGYFVEKVHVLERGFVSFNCSFQSREIAMHCDPLPCYILVYLVPVPSDLSQNLEYDTYT
jgi:hypothetical protein